MSNQTEPKFVPGEKVFIQSQECPQVNGFAVVTEAEFVRCTNPQWGYKTTNATPDGNFLAESALRKLPPDQSILWADSVFQPDREKVKP